MPQKSLVCANLGKRMMWHVWYALKTEGLPPVFPLLLCSLSEPSRSLPRIAQLPDTDEMMEWDKSQHEELSCESSGASHTCAQAPAPTAVHPSSLWPWQGAEGGRGAQRCGVLHAARLEGLESHEGRGGSDLLPFAVSLWSLWNGKCLPCVNGLL